MTREEAITNLNMISVAFVEPVTKEQRKLIDDTFDMAIKALERPPKTGHWNTYKVTQGGINEKWLECSECMWSSALLIPRNYCPNCGARMESEE